MHDARHLRDVRKKAGIKAPRKRKKLPRQIYPRKLEAEYAEGIAEMSGRAARRAMAPLLAELSDLLRKAAGSRTDGLDIRTFAGLKVLVESPKGSTRRWAGGETTMKFDYGYLADGYLGSDNEEVDVYLG